MGDVRPRPNAGAAACANDLAIELGRTSPKGHPVCPYPWQDSEQTTYSAAVERFYRKHQGRLMYYELWDVEVGNGIARYSDDTAMAMLVRTLVDTYGHAYAEDLDLAIAQEVGAVRENLNGPGLIKWVNVIMHRSDAARSQPKMEATGT